MADTGRPSQRETAAQLGVNQSTVSKAKGIEDARASELMPDSARAPSYTVTLTKMI